MFFFQIRKKYFKICNNLVFENEFLNFLYMKIFFFIFENTSFYICFFLFENNFPIFKKIFLYINLKFLCMKMSKISIFIYYKLNFQSKNCFFSVVTGFLNKKLKVSLISGLFYPTRRSGTATMEAESSAVKPDPKILQHSNGKSTKKKNIKEIYSKRKERSCDVLNHFFL